LTVRRLPLSRPFAWLIQGWDDLRHNPSASIAYGLLVSTFGALILGFWRHPYLIAASISGFLLVGPLLTTGLCELSRRRARGERTDFDGSLSALGRNRMALLQFASGLLLISVAWFGLSSLMIHLALGGVAPSVQTTIWGGVFNQITTAQWIAYAAVGGVLAAIVFARSVVSVPLIIDRDADAQTAVQTSHRVTLQDLPTMLLWAALIVALVAVGFGTFLVGMILVFPLLGHATWHAYDELVGAATASADDL
jgi:uncharacterized membrane protein